MRKHLTSDNTQLVKEKRKNILQLERSQSFPEITLTSRKKKKGKGFRRVLSMTYLCVSTNGKDELISSRSTLLSMCVRIRTNLSDISVGERERASARGAGRGSNPGDEFLYQSRKIGEK